MFSLIIPYHNREKFLPRTLKSIEDSTVQPTTIFLVNNASTDNSEKICQQFKEKHPNQYIVLLNEIRKGVSFARNTALKEVTTEWVYFFDSDDELSTDFFEKILTIIPTLNKYDLIACATQMIFSNGKAKNRKVLYSSSVTDQILSSQLSTQSMWFRTSFLRQIGGWNEKLPVWNDWELGVRVILNNAKIFWIKDQSFHRIFQHEKSLTGKNFSSRFKNLLLALETVHTLSNNNATMLTALSYREAILAAHIKRERNNLYSQELLHKAIATINECKREKHSFAIYCLYYFTYIGGHGAWQIARFFIKIAHF